MQSVRRHVGSRAAAWIASGLVLSACAGGESLGSDAGDPTSCLCDARAEMEALVAPVTVDCSNQILSGELQQCVSEAVAARASFLVEIDPDGTASRFLQYLVGNGARHAFVFVGSYDGDPSNGGGACPVLNVTRCASFLVRDEVRPSPGTPFDCIDPRESFRLCGSALQFDR